MFSMFTANTCCELTILELRMRLIEKKLKANFEPTNYEIVSGLSLVSNACYGSNKLKIRHLPWSWSLAFRQKPDSI